jgi:hypothetical protein
MMQIRGDGLLVACLISVCLLVTAPAHVMAKALDKTPMLVGEGRLSVLFWDIYEIQLFSGDGRYDPQRPVALVLNYLRPVSGRDIADTSIDEIRKLGVSDAVTIAKWQAQLIQLFPDIAKGDRLIGSFDPDTGSQFHLNGALIGVIDDPELSRRFFDIWLSEATSQPRLRRQLLGLNP